MSDDRNIGTGPADGPARAAALGTACAIAGVRGDVTTMRAWKAVEERSACAPPGINEGRGVPVAATAECFPVRLSDVGPA